MNLEINSLSKSFDGKTVIKNFSYRFPDKGIFVITGRSGIGKTTLLRIIAGLDKNFSGSVSGGGINNVSYAFQEYRLFPNLSALDNLLYAVYDKKNDENIAVCMQCLRDFGFNDSECVLFPKQLSGGMKQRVSLCRAFLRKAPILLLDEPSKELDGDLRAKLYELIKTEALSRLVITVSHQDLDILGVNGTVIDITRKEQ